MSGKAFKVNSENKLEKQRNSTKKKIEFGFQTGNMRNAWKGLKTLAGQTKPKGKMVDDVEDLRLTPRSLRAFF